MEKPFEIVREKMHTGIVTRGLDMGKPDGPDIWTYRKSRYDKSVRPCSETWLKNEKEKSPRGGWPRDPMTVTGCTEFLTFVTRDGARWPPPMATRMSHHEVSSEYFRFRRAQE